MNVFIEELAAGWPDTTQLARIVVRLVAAVLLGGVVGIQRERTGKPAGVRTHMLVSLGTALFVIAALEFGMATSDLSRIIQGLVTGIGFIGAGSILKLAEEREITGLTTAASIWLTAAVGVTVGLGQWGVAVVGVILTWIILSVIGQITTRLEQKEQNSSQSKEHTDEPTVDK